MTEPDPKIVELPTRFSQSKFWQIQRNYFATMGISAWDKEVPLYISSNAFIGQRYALLVANFLQDWLALHPGNEDQPFYILELGSGPGKFSYYFLQAFKELLASLNLEKQKFLYILSDVIPENLTFCKNNRIFEPFIANNEMDFTLLNVDDPKDFYLERQQKNFSELKKGTPTPLIVIANYTFDCIQQDAFECNDGKMQEVKLGLKSRYKNFNVEKVKYLDELFLQYHNEDIDINTFYEDQYLNDLLKQYQEQFKDKKRAVIMIPLGAINFMKHLADLTEHNFFMIVGDKGVTDPERFPLLDPAIRATYDGCYSFIVNFHALGNYLKDLGGDYLLTRKSGVFKVNLFSMGNDLRRLTQTRTCFDLFFERDGPDEYCSIYEEFLSNGYRFSIRTLLAFVKYSQYDPEGYLAVYERLLELLPGTHSLLVEEIKIIIEEVKKRVFPLVGEDVYNALGLFYQNLNLNDQALALYHLSVEHFGDKTPAHHNLGIIYEKQRNFSKALPYYEKAYAINKHDQLAKRKIYQLTGKPFIGYFYPLFKGALLFGILILGILLMHKF